jgi:hypothetical protein
MIFDQYIKLRVQCFKSCLKMNMKYHHKYNEQESAAVRKIICYPSNFILLNLNCKLNLSKSIRKKSDTYFCSALNGGSNGVRQSEKRLKTREEIGLRKK